ncbi:MAG: hypothetical protein R6V57_08720 [Vicinamibacterales bacterium]
MSRSTLIGIVVIALVAAGVLWVRLQSSSTSAVPPGQTIPAPASGAQRAPAPAADDEALPDVTLAAGTVDLEGLRITLTLSPQPPVAFATTHVRVRAEAGGSVVPLEGGRVSFEMTMPMGDHRYSLVAGQDGWQEAEVILPRCLSGKRRWYATVDGSVAGEPRTARFRFDLAPPGQAPAP